MDVMMCDDAALLLAPRLASIATTAGSVARIETQSTHLITGGTGGLGLLTARWLAQGGVAALALASRSGTITSEGLEEERLLNATASRVLFERCDPSGLWFIVPPGT